MLQQFLSAASLVALVLQYLGLLAERWFFFAQANPPQNLYYQTIFCRALLGGVAQKVMGLSGHLVLILHA
ncbi:MAG: hypothetical protein WBI05_04125 [Rhodoferax sp.]|nr:hypothetical protein [Rhodoferax sp.]